MHNSQEIIQKFVVYAYSKKPDCDLDELRFHLFQKFSSNELRNFPPSKDALMQQFSLCLSGRMGVGKHLASVYSSSS